MRGSAPLKFRQMGADCRQRQQGFTLIEMSIVLVIIGLIIGGIVKGQEVVNGARLKSQVAQIDAIKGAVFTFQDKYSFLPGDYSGNSILGLGTIMDGNENGAIATNVATSGSLADSSDVSTGTEAPTAWVQLAVANLLAGIQTTPAGKPLSAATGAIYAGKAGNSYLWLASFNSPYGPTTTIARLQAGTGAPGPILREQDAYTIDQKFDDGVPGTGSIIMSQSSTTGCIDQTPASNISGTYTSGGVSPNTLTCVVDFIIE